MSRPRALPEFWYPVARMLLMLKALLMATPAAGYASISVHICRELRFAGAFLRRYLLALARTLVLPPLRAAPARPARYGEALPLAPSPRRDRAPRLNLSEPPPRPRAPGAARADASDPQIEWTLAWQRTQMLLAALRHPLPIARALARRLAREGAPPAGRLPRSADVPRALAPGFDHLLQRLSHLARPDAPPDTNWRRTLRHTKSCEGLAARLTRAGLAVGLNATIPKAPCDRCAGPDVPSAE
jgi:hypothetical protein